MLTNRPVIVTQSDLFDSSVALLQRRSPYSPIVRNNAGYLSPEPVGLQVNTPRIKNLPGGRVNAVRDSQKKMGEIFDCALDSVSASDKGKNWSDEVIVR